MNSSTISRVNTAHVPDAAPAPVRASLRQLTGDIRGIKRAALPILLIALALEVCQILAPLLLKIGVDRVIPEFDRNLLLPLVAIFVVIALLQGALSYARTHALIVFGERLNVMWLSNLFTHLTSLPMRFFESRSIGEVAAKFWSVTYVQRVVTAGFVEGLLDGVMGVFTLAVMLTLQPSLVPLGIVAMLAYAGLRRLLFRRQLRADELRAEHSIGQQSHLWETISGIQSIKLCARQSVRKRRWLERVMRMLDGERDFQTATAAIKACSIALCSGARVAIIAVGAMACMRGNLSYGGFFAFVAYNELFMTRMSGLVDRVAEFQLLDAHRRRISEIVLTDPERDRPGLRSIAIEPQTASIDLVGVGFRYDGADRPVFSDVDIHVRAGECIAFVGPSGCGKTTLVRVMLGLMPPSSGQVRIAGTDLRDIPIAAYRRAVATVTMQDKLFAGSIFDNISFFDERIDEAWARDCAMAVDIHDEIENLPQGYRTVIKDDGAVLSAGQRQRLILARALYRRPCILFLDEATSHLDPHRERLFVEYLRRQSMTRIVVSHRQHPLSAADRVFEFHDGGFREAARHVPEDAHADR